MWKICVRFDVFDVVLYGVEVLIGLCFICCVLKILEEVGINVVSDEVFDEYFVKELLLILIWFFLILGVFVVFVGRLFGCV